MRNKRTLAFPSPFFLVGSSLTSLGMSSAKRKASPPPAGRGKRKRVVLTISQKLEICDLVTSRRLCYGDIARKYGIGRQTVADIKKKEKDLREFQRGEFQRVFIIQTIWVIQTHEKVHLPNTVWIIEIGLYVDTLQHTVQLKGHPLVCSNDGGCHSQLRFIRSAATHYPVLVTLSHHVYRAIGTQVQKIDRALCSGDFHTLMEITKISDFKTLLSNEIDTSYEQCTEAADCTYSCWCGKQAAY